jgi:uncharacterized protein (UPF0371 family)
LELLMDDLHIEPQQRRVLPYARQAAADTQTRGTIDGGVCCCAAIELPDGTIITGKSSSLMHAPSSLILNATKHLAGIPDAMHLLPPTVIESVNHFKKDVLSGKVMSLDLSETLIALSISAAMNPAAQMAVERLSDLRGCEVHITHIPTPADAESLRKLGLNVTSDPDFLTKSLFVE